MRIWRAALVGLFAACGSGSGSGGDYTSIEVEPATATLTIPLGSTASQDYKVFGVHGSARTEITTDCVFAMDPDFGSFAAATATVLPRGGKTTITATCDELSGTALLGVNLVGSVVTPPAPDDAPMTFDNATPGSDAARTPLIEYPLDRAVSPRNMPPIETQWTAGGNDLFHVRLTSTFVDVHVYTTAVEAMLAEQDWDNVLASSAGETLTIAVEGLAQADPSTKFASTPVTLTIARDTIDRTAIYYWASSQGNVMEQTFGTITQPNLVKGDCTSCHSVNRAGNRIGYSRCVGNNCNNLDTGFLKYDAATKTWNEAINANDMTIHGSYTTFAPNLPPFSEPQGAAIVSMGNGTLQLYDPDTGMVIPSNLSQASVMGPTATRSALMADWSPDGKSVVFASTPHANQWIDLGESSIAVMSYEYTNGTHTFGAPQFPFPNPVTLQNGTYTNFFFPSYSPDGALIVVNAARIPWRNGSDARAAGSRLMVADASGAWLVDMADMNGGYVDLDTTWARWAPTVGDDYYWIVFSSQRDYGHRATLATRDPSCVNVGVIQCKQIWIGAVAKNKLTGLVDPSSPPMWLPGQDVKAANISPYWSVPAGLQ